MVFSGSILKLEGSGFIWDDMGHIVTNWHVIQNASDFRFINFFSFHFLFYQFSLFFWSFVHYVIVVKMGFFFVRSPKLWRVGKPGVCNIYFLIVRGPIYEQGHYF